MERPHSSALAACTDADRGPAEFSELSRRVRQAGLLERRRGYYAVKISVNLLLLAAGWWAFVEVGDSWWTLLVAAGLGLMFTQVVFVGHDAGHRQIFRSRHANHLVGLLHGDLLTGLSIGWWTDKHNRHHAHPNEVDRDPDIGTGVIAFTTAHADAKRGPARLLARHQAYFFFPLLLLEALNLHVASVRSLSRRRGGLARWEQLAMTVHLVAYFGGIFLVLSPGRALAFIAVQQGLFGLYLGFTFAPNHKGMPTVAADDELDFFHRQVLTARNVRGGRCTALLLGGLNYQIEHHLFPTMPRPSLRRCRLVVRSFCEQHGFPYHETSMVASYREALRHLKLVGAGTV